MTHPVVDGRIPVETVLAVNTVKRAVWVAPPLIVLFALTRGLDGGLAAVLGIGVVVGNFLLAGAMLSLAIKISISLYHAVALFGFFLRLGLIVGTMLAIVTLVEIDRLAFGVAAVAAYMVLLVLEAVSVARGRERELDWTP